jgi:hypothetical protein
VKLLTEGWQFCSPPQLARYVAIDPGKVHSWIASGELRAANIATTTDSRPVWRISRADFESFWAARAVSFIKPERNPASEVRRGRGRPRKSFV